MEEWMALRPNLLIQANQVDLGLHAPTPQITYSWVSLGSPASTEDKHTTRLGQLLHSLPSVILILSDSKTPYAPSDTTWVTFLPGPKASFFGHSIHPNSRNKDHPFQQAVVRRRLPGEVEPSPGLLSAHPAAHCHWTPSGLWSSPESTMTQELSLGQGLHEGPVWERQDWTSFRQPP